MSYEELRVYEDDYKRIFKNAHKALIDCDFNITKSDLKTGKLQATSGMTLTSFGETLDILIGKTKNGVELHIMAKPFTWDIGNSKRDVEDFFEALDNRLRSKSNIHENIPTGSTSVVQPQKNLMQNKNIKSRRMEQKRNVGYLFLSLGVLLLIILPALIIFRGISENNQYAIVLGFFLMIGFFILGYNNIKNIK